MSAKVEVGLAHRDEAPDILGLFTSGFPADRQPWIPLGCPGALVFVRDSIERQELGGESHWVVARDGGVVGCAEIRRTPGRLFLNHVLVRPDLQRQGVGRLLLREGFAVIRQQGVEQVALDVFADNTRALRWYERLGFAMESVTCWETGAWSVRPALKAVWSCLGLPQADCVHARYGFSTFELVTPRGGYQVGRLGSGLFRVSDERILTDPDAAAALEGLGPERQVLLLRRSVPGPCPTEPGVLACGLRMSAPLDEVLGRLGRA